MAPVHHGHFSFDEDIFYVTIKGGHTHARATYEELQDVFTTDLLCAPSEPDHPGHWYQAQLIHYGLAATQNIALAKITLQDAFQDCLRLEVPKEVIRIEKKLRKQWVIQNTPAPSNPVAHPSLNSQITVTCSSVPSLTARVTVTTLDAMRSSANPEEEVSCPPVADGTAVEGNLQLYETTAPYKRRKTNTEEQTSQPVQTVGANVHTTINVSQSSEVSPPIIPTPILADDGRSPAVQAVDACGESGSSQSMQISSNAEITPAGQFSVPGLWERPYIPSAFEHEEPVPQSESGPINDKSVVKEEPKAQPVLGPINGEYEIISKDFEYWPERIPEDGFSLALCVEGQVVWGEYNFGMFRGILLLQQLPTEASTHKYRFQWRGEDGYGFRRCGAENDGWICFLGDKQIEGEINCCGWREFWGERIDIEGLETCSPPRNVQWVKNEWQRLASAS